MVPGAYSLLYLNIRNCQFPKKLTIFIYARNFSEATYLTRTGFPSIFLAAKLLFKGLLSGSPMYMLAQFVPLYKLEKDTQVSI